MALITYKRGLSSALSTLPVVDGQIIFCTDTREMFIDNGTNRLRIGDFVQVASADNLPTSGANETALYYIADINCLAKWNGTGWVQINRDTGVTSVEVTGSGNAVTAASYDPKTRKLTLTKGETFATKAFVGEIPETYTETNIVAYVNKKAEETLAAAQGGSSETAASVKAALDTYKASTDPRLDALEADTHTHTNKAELDKIETGDKAKWDAVAADHLVAADKTELQGNINTVSGKVTTLIGEDAGKSVRTIANEELAAQLIPENAKESLDTLSEIAAWIQAHPDDASAMNAAIAALQAKVDTGDQKVSEYVAAAIDALKIGDYAKAADLTAAVARIAALEADTHTHANKALLDTYTQTEANLADAVAKKHAHDNKAVIDQITQEMIDSLSWGSF